ncbi:MAG: hypothetical protein Q8P02_00085 [Candidatus Micrarchaeota archaeon]|nr:hypothetical protein [Candidatus Micrarchaeota archaeon]
MNLEALARTLRKQKGFRVEVLSGPKGSSLAGIQIHDVANSTDVRGVREISKVAQILKNAGVPHHFVDGPLNQRDLSEIPWFKRLAAKR